MTGPCSVCIDNILEFLNGIKDAFWPKHNVQADLKLLKTFVCYTAKWSDEDKLAHHLASLLSEIEEKLKLLEGYLSSCFGKSDNYKCNITPEMMDAIGRCNSVVSGFRDRVAETYDNLLKVAHPPMTDYSIFDEFVTSVHEYLVSLSLELESYFNSDAEVVTEQILSSSKRAIQGYYTATANKLGSFRSFIRQFASRCIDEEKLQRFLARAGIVVLSIAHLACRNKTIDRHKWSFSRRIVAASMDLSYKLSLCNPDVKEIYRDLLESYVEFVKAAKELGPVSSSMTVEDLVNSFFMLLLSSKNQVEILGDLFDLPMLDIVAASDIYTTNIELLLTHGVAAVAREAASLSYLICIDELPNVKELKGRNLLVSKMQHKFKLIKAEIFLLELHKQKGNLMVPEHDRLDDIREAMGILGNIFKTSEGFVEDTEKLMITLIEAVVREAGSLCSSCQTLKITDDLILGSSLAIFKLFKAEARLMVLIKNNASLKFLAKYRIETFHKCLLFLRSLLSDAKDNLEEGNYPTFIEAMVSEATFLVCSFGEEKMEINKPMEMDHLLSHLPKMIELNYADIKANYQKLPWSLLSTFPKSDGVVFNDFLLGEMRELLASNPDKISFVRNEVEELMGKLEYSRAFLKDTIEQPDENKNLLTRLLCLMYEAEYIIDMFVVGDVPLWYCHLALFNAIEETNFIKAEALDYYLDKKRCDTTVQNAKPASSHTTLEASNPRIEEVIVGFDDQADIIVDQLMNGSQQLQIISIVGMPGLGKTTLAKKVYSNMAIEYHFIAHAWCCVSQVYRKRELILDILGDFVELTDKIKKMDDDDLARTLYQNLKRKRYLIIMDDIWTIGPWNDLKSAFPDDRNGSRVLFTSRIREVALQINPKIEPHSLQLLSEEESLKLLQTRLFPGGNCPEDLLEIGGLIAKGCKGLPLAVVVVAALLKRALDKEVWWKEVAESLRSLIMDDQDMQFKCILELSYNHLPTFLKPCFLYLGAFLEDEEIPVQKLKLLWIAEGFIPKSDLKSLQQTADDYLMDLVGRSLIMEARRSSKGRVKACRMHDMLRDLCLEKAREENFMQLISPHDAGSSRSYYASDFTASMHYRLCVHSSKVDFSLSKPFGPYVHSLLFSNKDSRYSYDISSIAHKFRLLRVLDLENISIGESFPSEIELMFRIRYLAIRGDINSVPSSIANLWSLETLIVKGTRGEVVLPDTIWSMARLRHLRVNTRANFTFPSHDIENSVLLDNLTILSSPVLSYGKETEKVLRRLISLKKLRCIFLDYWDEDKKCNLFPVMDFLDQLESLKIFYHGSNFYPCDFSFPLNLKKLTLSKFRLPWEYISAIGRLPNLEVLKLLFKAFEGQTWDATEGEFCNLKYLKLDNLDIANWNASSDHFPKLKQLVLQRCKNLEEVPSCFGDIYTLEMIEVYWCSPSAANSVTIIEEQQLEMGNEEFKVSISPAEWHFKFRAS